MMQALQYRVAQRCRGHCYLTERKSQVWVRWFLCMEFTCFITLPVSILWVPWFPSTVLGKLVILNWLQV